MAGQKSGFLSLVYTKKTVLGRCFSGKIKVKRPLDSGLFRFTRALGEDRIYLKQGSRTLGILEHDSGGGRRK